MPARSPGKGSSAQVIESCICRPAFAVDLPMSVRLGMTCLSCARLGPSRAEEAVTLFPLDQDDVVFDIIDEVTGLSVTH